jgi:hypothetical protein
MEAFAVTAAFHGVSMKKAIVSSDVIFAKGHGGAFYFRGEFLFGNP